MLRQHALNRMTAPDHVWPSPGATRGTLRCHDLVAPASQVVAAARAVAIDDAELAGILTLDPGDIDATPDAWKGGCLVPQPWGNAIPALKAKNPNLKIRCTGRLRHPQGRRVGDRDRLDRRHLPGGGREQLAAHRRRWARHRVVGLDRLYPADIGRAATSSAGGDNVLAELRKYHWTA